jgi:hypothetical protein
MSPTKCTTNFNASARSSPPGVLIRQNFQKFLDLDHHARYGPYECDLHGVWDTTMIQRAGMNRGEYVHHEDELIRKEMLETKRVGTPRASGNKAILP